MRYFVQIFNKIPLQSSKHPSIQATKVGTAECAERLNSPYPDRGAGVLDSSGILAVPGELASPYLSAGLCGDRRSIRWPACRPLFSVFFIFFGGRKNGQKTDRPKIDFFPEMLAISVPPTSIYGHVGSQNGSPEGPPDVFFGRFFQTEFCIDVSSLFR